MRVNIKKFLEDSGISQKFYPGKKLVRACPQPGEYKSHSVSIDWQNPSLIRIEIKAGQSGRNLPADQLKKYPVSFQSPTYVEIDMTGSALVESDEGDPESEEESGTSTSGKGGSGKKPSLRKPLEDDSPSFSRSFGGATEGQIPDSGQITKMVVAGMQISARAYERVWSLLSHQITQARIITTDLLAEGGKFITRYTPPASLKPKGNENAVYQYDRSKNEPMFGAPTPR